MNFSLSQKFRIFLILILCGIFLGTGSDKKISQKTANLLYDPIQISGMIESFPDKKQKYQQFFLRVENIFRCQQIRANKTCSKFSKNPEELSPDLQRVLVRVPVGASLVDALDRKQVGTKPPPTEVIDFGQKLHLQGKLLRPRNFSDSFDYKRFLARYNIYVILQNPQILEISENKNLNFFDKITKSAKNFRNILEKNLQENLPSPHYLISGGILLGVKEVLPEPTKTHFENAGLQHILVVSGFNVVIIMFLVTFLLKKFGRRIIFWGNILTLFFFVLMVGPEMPVIRAAIFGGLGAFSVMIGRGKDLRNSLLFVATAMAIFSPDILRYDVSFHLSFIATIGILFLTPKFEIWLKFIPNLLGIRTILSVTLGAQCAVMPLLFYYFEGFPLGGIIANILVEPIIPILMLLSSIIAFGAEIFPQILMEFFSFYTKKLLDILFFIGEFFAQFPILIISPVLAQWGVVGLLLWLVYCIVGREGWGQRTE